MTGNELPGWMSSVRLLVMTVFSAMQTSSITAISIAIEFATSIEVGSIKACEAGRQDLR